MFPRWHSTYRQLFREIVEAERTLASKRPFVLSGQPTLFDPHRSPARQTEHGAYCHVPNGSREDKSQALKTRLLVLLLIRDCLPARSVSTPRLSDGIRIL